MLKQFQKILNTNFKKKTLFIITFLRSSFNVLPSFIEVLLNKEKIDRKKWRLQERCVLVIFQLRDNGTHQMAFQGVRWILGNGTILFAKLTTLKLRNAYKTIIQATFGFSFFLLIVLLELTPFPFLQVDVAP